MTAGVNLNLGQAGSGGGIDAASADNFGGELGLFRFENTALHANDVQQRFEAINNAPRITSINGTAIEPGALIDFISIENSIASSLTVDENGSLVFNPRDPNGSFNQLRAGDIETIKFDVEVQTGIETFETTSTFNIAGLNDVPIQGIFNVSADRAIGENTFSLTGLVTELDGTAIAPAIQPNNIFLTTPTNGIELSFDGTERFLKVDPQFFPDINSTVVQFTVTDADNGAQVIYDLTVNFIEDTTTQNIIAGVVAHDIDIDGSIDGDEGFELATVFLYSAPDGTVDLNNGAFLEATATTDDQGRFEFDQTLDSTKEYFVVVDSLTLSLEQEDLNYAWAQQTYASQGAVFRSDGTLSTTLENGYLIGGKDSELSDIFTVSGNRADAQHIIAISSAGNIQELEFGFNFDVVNVTNDVDQFMDPTRPGLDSQGTLRQFIQNANTIDGINRMVFLPTTPASDSNAAGDQWWKIELEAELPAISDDLTIIDGNAFRISANELVPYELERSFVQGTFAGQTVGVDGDRIDALDLVLDDISVPYLEITRAEFNSSGNPVREIFSGLTVRGDSDNMDVNGVEILNISIHGFGVSDTGSGGANNTSGNIVIDGDNDGGNFNVSDFTLAGSVIGVRPDFTQFSVGHNQGNNIVIVGAVGSETGIDAATGSQLFSNVIENNLIANADFRGIYITAGESTPDNGDNSSGWVIENNQVSLNGLARNEYGDGIEINNGSRDVLILGNYINANHAIGIDTNLSSGSHSIRRNTIENNMFEGFGTVVQTGGIRLSGISNNVFGNTIRDNAGAGVHVVGEFLNDGISGPSLLNIILSNEFSNNEGPAIDNSRPLIGNLDPNDSASYERLVFDNGDGNDENDQSFDDATGNFGIDSPEIVSAFYDGNELTVTFSANLPLSGNPSDVIEIYRTINGIDFGEGNTFLGQVQASDITFEDGVYVAQLVPPTNDLPIVADQALSINATISSFSIEAIRNDNGDLEFISGFNTSEFGKSFEILVNRPPTFSPNQTEEMIVEGNTLVGTITAEDLDDDNLTFTKIGGADEAFFVIDNNGVLSFISPPDFESPASSNGDNFYEVTIEVEDDNEATATLDVTVEVTARNEAPFFDAIDPILVAERDDFSQRISATDPDGDTLTYSKLAGEDADLFQVTSSGTVSFTAPDFIPDGDNSYQLQLRVTDGEESAITNVTFVVENANRAPFFDAIDPILVAERDDFSQRISATDPDGDTLTYSKLAGEDADLFQVTSSGTVSFTAPDFIPDGDNSYQLQLRVTDGEESAITNVTFVVENANRAPFFDAIDPILVAERDDFSQRISATDPDGDTLTYSKLAGEDADLFQVTSSGTVSFTAPDFIPDGDNSYQLQLRVTDGEESAITNVTFVVENVNERPEITSVLPTQIFDVEQIDAGQGVDLSQLSTFDPDDDSVIFDFNGDNNDNALFAIIDNQLRFNATPDLRGGQQEEFAVSIVANDGRLNSTPETISIVVNNQNDIPVFTRAPNAPIEVQETDDSLIFQLRATDRDGDDVIFEKIGGANAASFQITEDGRLSLINSTTLFGTIETPQTLEVRVRATDGLASTDRTIQVLLQPEVQSDGVSNIDRSDSTPIITPVESGEQAEAVEPDSEDSNNNDGRVRVIKPTNQSNLSPEAALPVQTDAPQPIDINGLAAVANLNLSDDDTFFDLTSDSVAYLSQSGAQGPQLITQELGDIIESRRIGEEAGLEKSLLAKYFWQGFDDSEDQFIRKNLKVDSTAIVAVPAGLTLGLVSYLRLAAMATSVFTQLPAWKALDVAPLISAFDEEEAETIHQIVDE